jgi:NAD(P)-dependent dehydrogenase (short-subunit alcohol dehydrogenase family)
MPLSLKNALITGSSRGIGRGIALKLAQHGVNIAVHYHKNEAAANDTLAKVRQHGADGFIIKADVTRAEDIRGMFDKSRKEFGKLDIFVSNARPDLADFYRRPQEITLDNWRTAMDSQASAFLQAAQICSGMMRDGGRIIAITYSSNTGSWQPWVGMAAAKAALDALVRYFAVDLAKRGITVNAISPGAILGAPNTVEGGVLATLPAEVINMVRGWHENGWTPMGRMGTPEDIGNAVSLLCMDEASFITGQVLHVDGGSSIMDPVFPLEIQRGPSVSRESASSIPTTSRTTQRAATS